MQLHIMSLHDLNLDGNVLTDNGKEQDANHEEEHPRESRFQENHSAIA